MDWRSSANRSRFWLLTLMSGLVVSCSAQMVEVSGVPEASSQSVAAGDLAAGSADADLVAEAPSDSNSVDNSVPRSLPQLIKRAEPPSQLIWVNAKFSELFG